MPYLILVAIAVYAAMSPYASTNTPPPGTRGSLVWGDAIFSNKTQLKAWLRLHGGSFESWAKTHPQALRLVNPKPRRHSALSRVKKPPSTKVAARKSVPHVARATASTSASKSHDSIGAWIVVALGLLLGALAIVPRDFLVRAGVDVGVREREVRLGAVVAGAALLVGVIVATIVG